MNIDHKKIIEHLRKTWGDNKPCPMCSNTNWGVDDEIFELRQYKKGRPSSQAPLLPLVPVTCQKCGHVVLLNPLTIDLLDESDCKEEVETIAETDHE